MLARTAAISTIQERAFRRLRKWILCSYHVTSCQLVIFTHNIIIPCIYGNTNRSTIVIMTVLGLSGSHYYPSKVA